MKIPASFDLETIFWKQGANLIAGMDEVGRGSWAGPVVAAAVIFPAFFNPSYNLYDSKLISPRERERLSTKILAEAVVGIGVVGVSVINKIGIGKSADMAFCKAVKKLEKDCDRLLIDAFYIDGLNKNNQVALKNGDKLCASIAAASIVAKVYRDALMRKLSKKYPAYGFDSHKGYGTKKHQSALHEYQLSKVHRTSFKLFPYLNA